jgi:hypothetical protein
VPSPDGDQPGVGIPGITGAARLPSWDAVASAHAPALGGDSVDFVALADGTLVVGDDVPDGALGGLADAVEEQLAPPYRATAVRDEGDVWSVAAQGITLVDLPGIDGDVVDLSAVGGARELAIDGEPTTGAVPELDALVEQHGDASVRAERVDGDTFAVDVFAL